MQITQPEQVSPVEPAKALSKWFDSYIDAYRVETGKLSADERKLITNTDNYFPPCQVEVFWLQEPEFQSIVTTHFADRQDREIIVNGPFKSYEFIDKVDKALTEPHWSRPVPIKSPVLLAGNRDTIGNLMSALLFNQIRQITATIFTKIDRPTSLGGQVLIDESWVSLFAGNIATTDPITTVDRLFSTIKAQALAAASKPTVQPAPSASPAKPDVIEATVAFVYPPISVGRPPEPKTLRDFVRGFPFLEMMKKAVEHNVGEERLVLTKDGMMALTTANKHIAIRAFNVVSALMVLEGIPAQTIRESEAGRGAFDATTLELRSWGISGSGARARLAEQRMFERLSWSQLGRTEVEESKVARIVERAERILKHPDMADELILWLESSTYFEDSDYAQSFIISWIMVERNLSNQWESFLRDKNVRGDRENKLTDSNRWPIDSVIETMNVAGDLPEKEYKSLMELKSKRNSYVHRGRKITKEDAKECLDLASEIMRHDLNGLLVQ